MSSTAETVIRHVGWSTGEARSLGPREWNPSGINTVFSFYPTIGNRGSSRPGRCVVSVNALLAYCLEARINDILLGRCILAPLSVYLLRGMYVP